MKGIVFLDLDGVCANFSKAPAFKGKKIEFQNHPEMYEPLFFKDLPVMEGAQFGVRLLLNLCREKDLQLLILSKPVANNPLSYTEKIQWVLTHFPELGSSVTLTQNKSLLSSPRRILIDDDQKWRDSWEKSGGEFIFFDEYQSSKDLWIEIVAHVETKINNWEDLNV